MACQNIGLLENRPPFADADDVFLSAIEGQQLAKPPDTRKIGPSLGRRPLGAPAMLKKSQALEARKFVPIISYVKQAPAPLASHMDLLDCVSRPTCGIHALLKGRVGHCR